MADIRLERFFQALILFTAVAALALTGRAQAQELESTTSPLEVVGRYIVKDVQTHTKRLPEKKHECDPADGPAHYACGRIITVLRKGPQLILNSERYGNNSSFLFRNKKCDDYVRSGTTYERLFDEDGFCRAVRAAVDGDDEVYVFHEDLDPDSAVLDDGIKSWAVATSFGLPFGAGFSSAYKTRIPAEEIPERIVIHETTKAMAVLLFIPVKTMIYRRYELLRVE